MSEGCGRWRGIGFEGVWEDGCRRGAGVGDEWVLKASGCWRRVCAGYEAKTGKDDQVPNPGYAPEMLMDVAS